MNAQELNDGEPNFLCPYSMILINNLHSFLEVGTYISFFVDFKLCYGRIVKASTQNEIVFVTVNIYTTCSDFEESNGQSPITLPPPITNRFIEVQEIFRTSSFCTIPKEHIHSVVFIFKTGEFLNNPYKGCYEIFFIWYEVNNSNNFSLISEGHCLPFPRQYKGAFPSQYKSYSYRINKTIQKIRSSLTHVMCRNAQANIGPFEKGYARFDCSHEFWTFFKFTCANIQVHGPYNSSRKLLKMRSFLDLCPDVDRG